MNDIGLDLFYLIAATYSKVLIHRQITLIVLQYLPDHIMELFIWCEISELNPVADIDSFKRLL